MRCFIFSLALLGAATKRKAASETSVGVGGAPSEKPFKASECIPDIIKFVEKFDRDGQHRGTEILDFFAGGANLCRRGRHRGYSCQTYDILLDKEQDILTYAGFFMGLLFCCQVERSGQLVILGQGLLKKKSFQGP